MAINEEARQVEVGAELEERARTLAHSTRQLLTPASSYILLNDLRASVDHLEQVCTQLARWHQRVRDGVAYEDDDAHVDGSVATAEVATNLRQTAMRLAAAAASLGRAHSANGRVRWRDES